jgi:hypothetical protein
MHEYISPSKCHYVHDYRSIINVFPEEEILLTIHEEISKFLNLLRIVKELRKFRELVDSTYS